MSPAMQTTISNRIPGIVRRGLRIRRGVVASVTAASFANRAVFLPGLQGVILIPVTTATVTPAAVAAGRRIRRR